MLREFQKEIEQLKKQLDNGGSLSVVCMCELVCDAASGSGSESGEEAGQGEASKRKKRQKRKSNDNHI